MGLDGLLAHTYGWTYDRLVDGFAPWEALVEEVTALVRHAAPGLPRVLDVACGSGAVARRLAARGCDVVGIDPVAHLVDVARDSTPVGGPRFYHADIARDDVPDAGRFDALVSMHTYYWHPDPAGFLAGCRRALGPGGHAIFLTYARPVRVGPDFQAIRRAVGLGGAMTALRWLLPTAVFETVRQCDRRYVDEGTFIQALSAARFSVVTCHRGFLAGMSIIVHARASQLEAARGQDIHATTFADGVVRT